LIIYLQTFGLVYRKAGGAEFSAAYVTRDRLGTPFVWPRRRCSDLAWILSILWGDKFRSLFGIFRSVFVTIAAEIQRHRFLDGFWYRRHDGLRFLHSRHCRCRDILDFSLTAFRMTVESLWLIWTSTSLARFRSEILCRRGGEYFQITRQANSWVLLLHGW
jgi:hypothetical protein